MSASLANIAVTMSSREIAELTGKRHDNVVRDIEKMLAENEIDRLKFEGVYLDAKGEERKCYNLPKDLTITLVAGYRSDLRLKIVRRWMELETAPTFKAPTNMREALMLALDQQEEIERQKALTDGYAPKAAAHDYLAELPGDLGVCDAGRELKVGQQWVTEYIDGHDWSCVEGGKRKPAHYGLKMGYCRFVRKPYKHPHTGEEMVKEEFRLTSKGIARLAEIIAKLRKENGLVPFAKKQEPAS